MGVPDVSAQVCRLGRSAGLRACLLRGLTVPGGIAAAATLGMPERADAGRNYDYRYVWLCDMAYAGLAAAVQDAHELLDEAMAFTTARVQTDGDKIRPSRHQTDGTPPPEETTLDLAGYPGGTRWSELGTRAVPARHAG